MTDWYYARDGQQSGPVTFAQLDELARNGGLDPAKDLVWTSTMKNWTPAGQVPELFASAPPPPIRPATDPANPYAAPQSAWTATTAAAAGALLEIPPGSDPIDVGECVKRGSEITTRHFGTILLVGLTYFGISIVAAIILTAIDAMLGIGQTSSTHWHSAGLHGYTFNRHEGSPLNMILTQVLSTYLTLGASRIGLNLVSGKAVTVDMLFGEGRKLLRTLGATILFILAVTIGLILFVVPGIYIALRYGQFLVAIVDRDLGIMEAFSYSSAITTNNRARLFLLALLSILIIIAGMLLCGVGLIFALPVVWLATMVAYRWMQFGSRAAKDYPGTQTPWLAG